jgi:hypothetical protein
MRGTEMAQQPEQLKRAAGRRVLPTTLRLLGVLAMVTILGTMLAACGRCGDFLSSSLGQIGACHSDAPPPQ